MPRTGLTLGIIALAVLTRAQAQHAPQEPVDFTFARDHFANGNTVIVTAPVAGDLIAAGRHVAANAAVGGDAVLAGGEVRANGRVNQDLYAAGGTVAVEGRITQNARIAGGQVTVARGAEIGGNVSAAGGEIRVEGRVNGYLQAAGGRVYLNAPIGGNVDIMSGDVELGPNANVAGKLRYASDHEMRQAAGARVQGGIERRPRPSGWSMPGEIQRQVVGWLTAIWTIGVMILAAIFVATLPRVSARVAATLQSHPGKSLLIGFGIFVGAPILIVLSLITLIGIPLALLSITLYVALLFVGYLSVSVALGDWALHRLKPADVDRKGWRIAAAVLAVLVLGLLGRIPGLGTIIVWFALLAGMGALLLVTRRARPVATTIP